MNRVVTSVSPAIARASEHDRIVVQHGITVNGQTMNGRLRPKFGRLVQKNSNML
jgi:hypothetical protein